MAYMAYGVSRNYKRDCDSLARTRETIGKKYTQLAILEKQIAAYHSIINKYGKLIEEFCAEKDETKRKEKLKEIYRKSKNLTVETDGYEFVKDKCNPEIILVQFYEFNRKLFYDNKFDIKDDFAHREIFSNYDAIKEEIKSLPALCLEREKEVKKYDDVLTLNEYIDNYDLKNNVDRNFEEIKAEYEEKFRYKKEVNLSISIPDEEGNEHARYFNRAQVRGLIKTLCAVTGVCQENQIPLSIETGWHVDKFGYCNGVEM